MSVLFVRTSVFCTGHIAGASHIGGRHLTVQPWRAAARVLVAKISIASTQSVSDGPGKCN